MHVYPLFINHKAEGLAYSVAGNIVVVVVRNPAKMM